MSLRHFIADRLMRWSLHLTRPPLTIEGIAVMKIWDAIVDLRVQVAAIAATQAGHGQVIAGSVDPDQFKALQDAVAELPTKDQVSSAIGAAMEEIVGDEPATPAGVDAATSGTGTDTLASGAGQVAVLAAGQDGATTTLLTPVS